MASYEVCQHCSNSVRASRAVHKGGYSYHRSCRKCYVCSETNLQDAEVFRGVIFCASCAKRIFKGCATARFAKQPVRRRRRRTRGVIERARAASSTSSLSSTPHSKTDAAVPVRDPRVSHDCYCVSDVVTQAKKLINFIYFQTHNLVKPNKTDIAQCSEACKRMLEDLCPASELKQATPAQSQPELPRNSTPLKISSACSTSRSRSRSRSKCRERKSKKMKKVATPCSDLRIAELGASIEIASMALRKNSTKKVPSKSKEKRETAEEPETISMFSNIDSVTSRTSNEEYLDSECQEYRGSKESDGSFIDNAFARIMKMPFINFKKNILERSSLISVIAGIDSEKTCISAFKRLKTLFRNDVLDHRSSGYKKLYPTINKKKMPYKLGWLQLDETGDRKTCPCKHYAECHSYRCMREQVMRLAGPTQSKMYVYRNKMKNIVPPFLKNISYHREHGYPELITGRSHDQHQSPMSSSNTRSSTKDQPMSEEPCVLKPLERPHHIVW